MRVNPGLVILLFMAWTNGAQADAEALNTAAQNLCNKTKVCLLQDMEETEDISPEIEEMMDVVVNEMCRQFKKIAEVHDYHDLIEPATACFESMSARSCDDLLNSDDDTQACKAYQSLADSYQ